MNSLTQQDRKRIGRYDTPAEIALPLIRWGLAGRPGLLLDPSYGGCNFLRSGIEALKELGAEEPASLIFGIDISQDAAEEGKKLVADGVPRANLRHRDFFQVQPKELPSFDLVVGNPPYIRHHWFNGKDRAAARSALASQAVELPSSASAWAYFIVHAGEFLKVGGRLAFLLPSSMLTSRYSATILAYLSANAGNCTLLRVDQLLFEDAQEATVLLLAENWRNGSCEIGFQELSSISLLQEVLAGGQEGERTSFSSLESIHDFALESAALDATMEARGAAEVVSLSEIASVSIGTVTGANEFFCRPAESQRLLPKEIRAKRLLPSGRYLNSLEWTPADQNSLDASCNSSRLLFYPASPRDPRTMELIREAEGRLLHQRHHCQKRSPWWRLPTATPADAFLRYMGSTAPQIVLNHARSHVTNNVHMVNWLERSSTPASAVLSSLTSLFGLECERASRPYGGGVLKVEPSAAKALPVAVGSVSSSSFQELSRLLRLRRHIEARYAADNLILRDIIGLSAAAVREIQVAFEFLLYRRTKNRTGT